MSKGGGGVCGRKCELRRLVKLQKLLQFLPSVPYWRRDLKRRSYSKQTYIFVGYIYQHTHQHIDIQLSNKYTWNKGLQTHL